MDLLENIGFENFKIFKDRVIFDIKPFTLFTGPNNSGKSTILDGIKFLAEIAGKDSGLKRIKADKSIQKNFESSSDEIIFITGIRAITPMIEWGKILKGHKKSFPMLCFIYSVERTYVIKKNTLILRKLKFFRHENLDQEFLKIEIISKNKVKINFDFKEFLLINGIDCHELLDKDFYRHLHKEVNDPNIDVSTIQEFTSQLFFEDIEIKLIEENTEDCNIKNFEINTPALNKSTNRLNIKFQSKSIIPELQNTNTLTQQKYNAGIGDFIIAYFFFIESSMTNIDFVKLKIKRHNTENEYFAFSSVSLFNKSLIKGIISCKQIFVKISHLEDEPHHLWMIPDLDVVRAPSVRLDKMNSSFQNILSRSQEWQHTPDKYEYKMFINILNYLGIGSSFEISKNQKGLLDFWIIEEDGHKTNLLDFGFGTNQIIPILLQVLFLNVDGMNSRYPILISEPEANLHPNMQSKFVEVLTSLYSFIPLNFLLESHSEYMIRRFQIQVLKKELKKEDIIIYYLSKNQNNSSISCKRIEIFEDGTLSDEFGPGFIDEADNLAIDLFNLKNINKN
jgi:predicted ATPase